jgi:hypothetical protein
MIAREPKQNLKHTPDHNIEGAAYGFVFVSNTLRLSYLFLKQRLYACE